MAEYSPIDSKNYELEDEEILSNLREQYALCESSYSDQRTEAEEDFQFYMGEQWTEDQKKSREREGKPTLSINYLGQFVDGIVNNYKRNRHEINIKPGDNLANNQTAEAFRVIVKDIQAKSFAENTYDTALQNAVICGEGYFRILTDYRSEKSFEQEVFIKPIEDIFQVYIDPNFDIDYQNIDFAFVSTSLTKNEFEHKFPDAEIYQPYFSTNVSKEWCSENYVRIVEYFYIERKKVTLVQTEDGNIYEKSFYNDKKIDSEIIDEKESVRKIVRWVLSNGYEILDKKTFPGTYIPIIPVFGKTVKYKNERRFEGIIRQAKNPQRKYNYYQCSELEVVALSPRAPWLIPEGAVEGYENDWKRANKANIPYLEYKTTDKQGNSVSAPSRAQFDTNINTIITAKQGSIEDIKATTGIYDPSLGKEEGSTQSGISILTRQEQTDNNTLGYGDNLSKSLKLAGRILIDIIPDIYDVDRKIKAVEKGQDKIISLADPDIDMTQGFYDVEVSIGPAGKTQRQEAAEAFIALAQVAPQVTQVGLDLFIRNQDWPMADELANRIAKTLPQELQENQDGNISQEAQQMITQIQQQAQAQMAQMSQQNQLLQTMITQVVAALNESQNKLDNKAQELASRERIAEQDNITKLSIEAIKQQANVQKEINQVDKFIPDVNSEDLPSGNRPENLIPGINDPITNASGMTAPENNREQAEQNIEGLEGFNPDDFAAKIDQQLTSPRMNYR